MATDRAEVLKNAEKLLRTGKLELAIAEYVRLVAEQPRDWNARHTLGDLYVRANQPNEAIAQYAPIADHYFTAGALPNAAALYRKILKVVPDEPSAARGLDEIADRLGVPRDAASPARALDPSIAADDPIVRLGRLETALRAGNMGAARRILDTLPEADGAIRGRILELGWTLSPVTPEGAYLCIETAVDVELTVGNYIDAAALLEEFTTRVPGQITALLKLADICVDGGLEATMYETQARLADAYLALGQGAEAREIAEGLVAREPWEPAHIDRFRRALLLSDVADPDAVIAERLSGKGPFVATDPFAERPVREPERPARPVPDPERDPIPETPPVDEPEPEPAPLGDPEPDIPIKRADAPAKRPAKGSMEIDLTDVLSALEGGASPDPMLTVDDDPDEEVDTRPSEDSRQADVQEAAEQLELGRTYLDMGMADEAIAAFERASKIPAHRFAAASLLGRLYLKKEDPARAVEWLERAAEAPAPSEEEGHELMYDLAATLEATGEVSRALAVFMELQSDAGDYRDVAERVDRLVQSGG